MPSANSVKIVRRSTVERTARVLQLEGLFEIPPTKHSIVEWDVDLPITERDWNIGLIVGPSGSGKTTLIKEQFAEHVVEDFIWDSGRSVVDSFPDSMSIKEITSLLCSVGFSDPPSWLRPFHVLSNGERWRVTIARALAEHKDELIVLDEFTSIVDRTVARIGSSAIERTVRERKQKLIVCSCHYDIIEWLRPDWTYEPAVNEFQWRELQRRPAINLSIRRVDKSAWRLFRHHHYLNTELNASARCFAAFWDDQVVAMISVLSFPHAKRAGWRLHRLVCLPDFQGIGIGVALSDYISGVFRASGKPVFRTAGHPAVVKHCAKSSKWKMKRAPSQTSEDSGLLKGSHATRRLTAGFEYVGPIHHEAAAGFQLFANGN